MRKHFSFGFLIEHNDICWEQPTFCDPIFHFSHSHPQIFYTHLWHSLRPRFSAQANSIFWRLMPYNCIEKKIKTKKSFRLYLVPPCACSLAFLNKRFKANVVFVQSISKQLPISLSPRINTTCPHLYNSNCILGIHQAALHPPCFEELFSL